MLGWGRNSKSQRWRLPPPPRGCTTSGLNGPLLSTVMALPRHPDIRVRLLQESRRGRRTALTRAIQVLEGDKDGLNACNLIFGAVSRREAERRDAWVIDNLARIEVAVQCSDNILAIWRACARNFDRLAIGAIDSTITIAR
jgi:hypothetical protein